MSLRLLGNGRYVLGEELGAGGMGTVYVAEDLVRIERVAIKLAHGERISPDVVALHMARELRAGRATQHPNVVSVIDGGLEDGRPFVVMELASGRTLNELVAAERMSIRRIAAVVDQILAGLAAIHAAGYVHGDIKTDNVVIEDGGRVKIIDLGLACEHSSEPRSVDEDRIISGTPQYLAPELAIGAAKSVASDLYAVGVILYELLTGTTPFAGGGLIEVLRKQVEEEVTPPSQRSPEVNLSLPLERVVLRALRKNPHERYVDAAEFRGALGVATKDSTDDVISSSVFAPIAPTVEWTRPEVPRPRALGTRPPAMAHRDAHVIIEAALDATRVHLEGHRLGAARDEIEAALRMIEHDPKAERLAWRLLLPLAAITDGLRDPCRARRIARLALDSAARAGSSTGRFRAKALIERFAGRGDPHH